ncbi:MAG: transglutaminase-like domain-containing protein [Candidatus Omnitrophica bacterium]|nr:transglutaminase-like domain-containing protein [Candidatus Omnitrophota bacterium]
MPKKVSAIFLSAFLFFCLPLFAETITLKSGKTVEGKIVERTDAYIKMEILGIPVTYYLDEIASLPSQAADTKNKKTVSYKVTKKFYLRAAEETHFLKFCMPSPQNSAVRQTITDIATFPQANAHIKDSAGADVPIFYFGLLKSGSAAIVGLGYNVEFQTAPLEIVPSSIPDHYPASDTSFEPYLHSEGDINISHPMIREKAHVLTASLKNPYLKAKAIYDFLTGYLQYDQALANQIMSMSGHESRKPDETLSLRKGICYDIAKLYVALARAAGVPARVVRGVAFASDKPRLKYIEKIGHAWAEIYLPVYGWVPVDPTFGLARKDTFFCFDNTSHIAEEYGLASVKEFGSVEKGWALQIRMQQKSMRFPLNVEEEIVIERIS